MTTPIHHISVCICTFKRPEPLGRALQSICGQKTGGSFSFSIVVSDNDRAESGRVMTAEVAQGTDVEIKYCVEPEQGIARARNHAVKNAKPGSFVAFIDDDEFAPDEWLLTLFQTLERHPVAGVLGPVHPHFDEGAPQWVIKSGLYDRPIHPTGMTLSWKQCRTGSVLLKRELFEGDAQPFNPECLSGEDQDFFRRKMEQGHKFVWCHEAPAYEVVPPVRWQRGFLMRRAMFRGIFAQRNHGLQPLRVLQALISAPLYAITLPIALLLGQARFMTSLFKMSYHTGRLLALFGFNPIRGSYVTE